VTITASQRQLQKVRQYLKHLEKNMHAQVMIEAYLIELTYTDEKSTGIDWSKMELNLLPNASYLANSDGLGSNFFSFLANFTPEGVMRFLNTYGDVDILSNPKCLL